VNGAGSYEEAVFIGKQLSNDMKLTLEQSMYAMYIFIMNESAVFKQHIARFLRYMHEQKLINKITKASSIDEVKDY